MVIEEWKPLQGWPYDVSNIGGVRSSLDSGHAHKGKSISRRIHGIHFYVSLKNRPRHQQIYVHRLVYETFCGSIPDGYVVHHKDGNPLNNEFTNLEILMRCDHARQHRGKLTNDDVSEIVALVSEGYTHASVANSFGISRIHVGRLSRAARHARFSGANAGITMAAVIK